MSNYREEQVAGTKWVRSNSVNITNPYGSLPSIHFGEEEITELTDGKKVNTPLPGITKAFDDPNTTFELVNPVTGEPLGVTSSYQQVYVMMHSLYMHLAKERDGDLPSPQE